MSRDSFRSVGAIIGLTVGLGTMWLLGFSGLVPLAIAGSVGAVGGGISGEQIHDRRQA